VLAGGLLNKQAAFELGITEYTVQFHRGHIMRKMEAESFAALVRMADKVPHIPHRQELEIAVPSFPTPAQCAGSRKINSKTTRLTPIESPVGKKCRDCAEQQKETPATRALPGGTALCDAHYRKRAGLASSGNGYAAHT
jgi:hypothetical protein